MGSRRSVHSLLLAATVALSPSSCTSERPPAPAPRSEPGVPVAGAPGEGKPGAPVDVRLESRELTGGEHELTLTATPSVDVDALELRLGDRRESVGRTPAGAVRTLRVRVSTRGGAAIDVAGGAAVFVGGVRQSRAATVRVGASAARSVPPAPPANVVTLPGGERVAEEGR